MLAPQREHFRRPEKIYGELTARAQDSWTSRFETVHFVDGRHSFADCVPQVIRNDALVRNLLLPPLVLRLSPVDSLPRFTGANFARLTPSYNAAIALIVQNVPD
jgi:hypothetical protein